MDQRDNYLAALRKRRQLEKEIAQHTVGVAQTNMLHTLSKLWMFLSDCIPNETKLPQPERWTKG